MHLLLILAAMKKAFVIASAVCLFWACSSDSVNPGDDPQPKDTDLCDSLAPTYTGHIKSILDGNCAPCHTSFTTAGINVATYTSAKAAAGQAIFMSAIRHEGGAPPMPKDAPKLSSEQIQLISCWIENGFPEN